MILWENHISDSETFDKCLRQYVDEGVWEISEWETQVYSGDAEKIWCWSWKQQCHEWKYKSLIALSNLQLSDLPGNVNVCNFQEFCPTDYLWKFRLRVGVNHLAIASVLLDIPLHQEVWQIWESECVLSNLIYQWGDLHTKKVNQWVQKPGKLLQYCFSQGWNYGTKLCRRTSNTNTDVGIAGDTEKYANTDLCIYPSSGHMGMEWIFQHQKYVKYLISSSSNITGFPFVVVAYSDADISISKYQRR